jgi:hypothetical protein
MTTRRTTVVGISGYSGLVGDTGNSGYSGYSGILGNDGANGPQGYSGYSGYSGIDGSSGAIGTSGYSGILGTSGYSGYSGQLGSEGVSGYSGISGISGYSGITAGTGKTLVREIAQTGHGFILGDIVRLDGSDYVKAQANNSTNAEVVGIVSRYIGVDDFELTEVGYITGLSGLSANTVYFLSATVEGTFTETDTLVVGEVSKPLLQAIDATSCYFFNWRGIENAEEAPLPIATDYSLGTIIVGSGLSVDSTGVVSVSIPRVMITYDDYTIQPEDDIVICDSTGAVTIKLLPATGSGVKKTIKNINTGDISLDGDGGLIDDGDIVTPISEWQVVTVFDYALNRWIII